MEVSRNSTEGAGTRAGREDRGTVTIRPVVDVFEDTSGITVQAEMPGVPKDGLQVRTDRDSLTIEGTAVFDLPSGLQPLHAEVQAMRYARSFTLSAELDPDRAEASFKDGLLTLRIPKRVELQPRRIEVR